MSPRDFAIGFIHKWEDGGSTDPNKTHSLDPIDAGNWSGGQRGLGTLIGSNHGVTAAALAQHRNVPVASVTRPMMHALTIDEAADIALSLYYYAPGFDKLPWNRVTMSVLDMGWGAGPAQAIKLLQRLIGATDDGQLGPQTVRLYAAWVAKRGEVSAASDYAEARNAYYDRIIVKSPTNAKYERGWKARSASMTLAGNPDWWQWSAA